MMTALALIRTFVLAALAVEVSITAWLLWSFFHEEEISWDE